MFEKISELKSSLYNIPLGAALYFLVGKKKPVDFDDELKTGDVRYDNLIKITIKVQLF